MKIPEALFERGFELRDVGMLISYFWVSGSSEEHVEQAAFNRACIRQVLGLSEY